MFSNIDNFFGQVSCIYLILISNKKVFSYCSDALLSAFRKSIFLLLRCFISALTNLNAQELGKSPNSKILLFIGMEEGRLTLCCAFGKYLNCLCFRTWNCASYF